jgi:hypothetical protein
VLGKVGPSRSVTMPESQRWGRTTVGHRSSQGGMTARHGRVPPEHPRSDTGLCPTSGALWTQDCCHAEPRLVPPPTGPWN